MSTPASDKLLLSIPEASERLNLNRSYVYAKLVSTGRLFSVKVGRRRLIPASDLAAYVENLRASQGARATDNTPAA